MFNISAEFDLMKPMILFLNFQILDFGVDCFFVGILYGCFLCCIFTFPFFAFRLRDWLNWSMVIVNTFFILFSIYRQGLSRDCTIRTFPYLFFKERKSDFLVQVPSAICKAINWFDYLVIWSSPFWVRKNTIRAYVNYIIIFDSRVLKNLYERSRWCSRHNRPPIPPQGVLRNESTFASANHNTQKCATVAESASKCLAFVRLCLQFRMWDFLLTQTNTNGLIPAE